MKAVILAGGRGTRLAEETSLRPKPMVEIGGKPILWHILKTYSRYGVNDFIICVGYKGYIIKEYFANYFLHQCDVTFHMDLNHMEVHEKHVEPWKVTIVDTGHETNTGGRLKHVRPYLGNEPFAFTYGDGVADIDIAAEIEFHHRMGKEATMTVVTPPGRYGSVRMREGVATDFCEKPNGNSWINGGYFILNPSVISRIDGPATSFEQETLEAIAQDGELACFRHEGFWQPMDTLREKQYLNDLWDSNRAPWKHPVHHAILE